jgi:hypothetical protein
MLDESTYDQAADDPDLFRATMQPVLASGTLLSFQLGPYAIVTLDGRLGAD